LIGTPPKELVKKAELAFYIHPFRDRSENVHIDCVRFLLLIRINRVTTDFVSTP
jgi:hypothetical protein